MGRVGFWSSFWTPRRWYVVDWIGMDSRYLRGFFFRDGWIDAFMQGSFVRRHCTYMYLMLFHSFAFFFSFVIASQAKRHRTYIYIYTPPPN